MVSKHGKGGKTGAVPPERQWPQYHAADSPTSVFISVLLPEL